MIRIVLILSCLSASFLYSQQKKIDEDTHQVSLSLIPTNQMKMFGDSLQGDHTVLSVENNDYRDTNGIPVQSEWDRLLAEYDDPDHGILFYIATYLYTLGKE